MWAERKLSNASLTIVVTVISVSVTGWSSTNQNVVKQRPTATVLGCKGESVDWTWVVLYVGKKGEREREKERGREREREREVGRRWENHTSLCMSSIHISWTHYTIGEVSWKLWIWNLLSINVYYNTENQKPKEKVLKQFNIWAVNGTYCNVLNSKQVIWKHIESNKL